MKTLRYVACVGLALGAVSASAQDAIMNSAETINKGNFKLAGYPIMLFGADGNDDETGIGFRAGYGFSRSFDAEVKLSFFDGAKYYGIDGEWWLRRGDPDVSVAIGVHRTSFDGGGDVTGLDTTALVSDKIADRLELYVGARIAWEFPEEPFDSYQRINLVPGLEYRLADDLDLLAEVGIKLNDDADTYVSAGLAYYIR
jgi:opacity protein-like surface antigen